MRASQPALLAAGRVIAELRDAMVTQWADWLGDRITAAPTIPRLTVEREFRLLLDVISEMVGPLRREVNTVWFHVCEHYGRVASARGLAAGEVVEELQFLRELLIRNLAPVLAAMRARQGMAIMLRLNRVIDKGIAVAVVGYTDALVATLFAQNGVPTLGRRVRPRPKSSASSTRWSRSSPRSPGSRNDSRGRAACASAICCRPFPGCCPSRAWSVWAATGPISPTSLPPRGRWSRSIVPARNEAANIETVVRSVLATTYQPCWSCWWSTTAAPTTPRRSSSAWRLTTRGSGWCGASRCRRLVREAVGLPPGLLAPRAATSCCSPMPTPGTSPSCWRAPSARCTPSGPIW